MPLILLLPLLAACVFALWVLLLPLSVVQRYRYGRARRRVQPLAVRINAWVLAVSALLFLAGTWVAGHWIADGFRDAAIGMAVGLAVGVLGSRLDRFEATDRGLYRTPNRWLVLALATLLALRIVLGLWLAWPGSGNGEGGWQAWLDRGGLLGVAGVLLGYAQATAWGLLARVRRGPG
jgi:uncharacterized membrane protein YidH (DUF202 family)